MVQYVRYGTGLYSNCNHMYGICQIGLKLDPKYGSTSNTTLSFLLKNNDILDIYKKSFRVELDAG
jgi:hypothetical protein